MRLVDAAVGVIVAAYNIAVAYTIIFVYSNADAEPGTKAREPWRILTFSLIVVTVIALVTVVVVT